MNHHAYPPHDRFREASVVLREELRLEGRDHHHAAPAIRNGDGHPDFRFDLRTVFTPRSSSGSASRWPVRNVFPSLNTQTTRPPFDRGNTSRPLLFCSAESGWVLLPIATSVSFSGWYRKASTLSASKAFAT